MTINERTISEMVKRGDAAKVYSVVHSLAQRLNTRAAELAASRHTAVTLRNAFIQTDTDRERLRRMVSELLRLKGADRLPRQAKKIIDTYGGLTGERYDDDAISIVLD